MTFINKILQQSSILYMVLQKRQTGLSFGISKIISFLDFLHNLKSDNSFNELFASVVEINGEPKTRLDLKYNYKRPFYEVNDNIVLNPHCFINWQNNIPVERLELMRMKFGPFFKCIFFISIKMQIFAKQVLQSYKTTSTNSTCNLVFKRFFKLLLLNATVVISSSSVETLFLV